MLTFKGYDADHIGFRTQASQGGANFWPRVNGVVDVRATATRHHDPCPTREGDGVCVALTARGAASGGHSLATGILLVGWYPEDEMARNTDKVRVARAKVLARIPITDFVRCGANLTGADLRRANLRGANLAGADLTGAFVTGANLRWANLRWANLRWAHLHGADLTGTNLAGADLRWANLRWADLHGADLTGADLTGTSLAGADLTGANLRWANLTRADRIQ